MVYGVEIWGWKKREELERMQKRYLRWMMDLRRETQGYMVREEVQREKLRHRAGKRAWGFEKRLEGERGSEIARKCWEEIKERARKGKGDSKWERERAKYFEDRGVGKEGWVGKEEREEANIGEVLKADKELDRKERWERIRDSKYNKWYSWIKGEKKGVPEYLK